MDLYSTESLYNDLLGYSYSDDLKLKPEGNNTMQDNYLQPNNNLMTEDAIYSMGMGAAPMNLDTPSPMMGYQELTPMDGYGNGPATNVDLDMGTHAPLQLPQDLTDMVNSLFIDGSDGFPVSGFDPDLDVNIVAAMDDDDDQEDDLFGNSDNSPYELAPPSYETTMAQYSSVPPAEPTTTTQRRRKTRKTKTMANASLVEAATASPSPPLLGYDPYPNPADLGVPSPASSSGYSDTCSTNEEGNGKPRQRRPRVSYATLTEEEKYKRIRDLNNEASRHYRNRQKGVLSTLEQQLPSLLEKNKHLKDKAAALERLRDQMKQYSNGFLRQHMSNTVNNGF